MLGQPPIVRKADSFAPRHALNGIVTTASTHQRTHEGKLIGHCRDLGEAFANLNAGHFRANRLELTANFGRCFGFDLPHILVGRAAAQEDVDYRFVGGSRFRGAGFSAKHIRECPIDGTKGEGTNLEETTARNTITISLRFAENGKHGRSTPTGREGGNE